MGCDIHCYPEWVEKLGNENLYTHSWGGRINPGRNYWLFCLMAGVRNHYGEIPVLFEPKGLPKDVGWRARDDNFFYVTDDRERADVESCFILRADAEGWVSQGLSEWVDKEGAYPKVTNPDWHSHSWLTPAELREVFEKYKEVTASEVGREWKALLAALEALGDTARLVFWFDN